MATQPWRCASPSLPGICVSEFSRQHTMALSQASNHGDPQATIVDGMEGGAAVLQSGGSRRIHTPLSCESMIHECHFHMGAPCMRRARACAVSPPAEPLGAIAGVSAHTPQLLSASPAGSIDAPERRGFSALFAAQSISLAAVEGTFVDTAGMSGDHISSSAPILVEPMPPRCKTRI